MLFVVGEFGKKVNSEGAKSEIDMVESNPLNNTAPKPMCKTNSTQ